jgi:endonuclease/exonuclease/phosphatase family metal-dependent hydrolase
VSERTTIRIATYNIHKCRGMDRRVSPARIADVIRQLDADVVALQEVVRIADGAPQEDQAQFIASELGYDCRFGENRRLGPGAYGNATLSRLPIVSAENYDITWRGRERRGAFRCDIQLGPHIVHVFNIHLGTAFMERRHQGRLLTSEIILREGIAGPRVVVGDFNEWTRGLASKLMGGHFESIDAKVMGRFGRTYPGVFPVLHLDHFYFDRCFQLQDYKLHRSKLALIASDHLPIVGELRLQEQCEVASRNEATDLHQFTRTEKEHPDPC